jgi:hypothetical protein
VGKFIPNNKTQLNGGGVPPTVKSRKFSELAMQQVYSNSWFIYVSV